MMNNKKTLRFLIFAAAIVTALGAMVLQNRSTKPSPYAEFYSPDGQFRIVIERQNTPWPFITMPGQGSDAPGIAKLMNNKNEILGQEKIEMVQMVNDVQWHANKATLMPGIDLFYSPQTTSK